MSVDGIASLPEVAGVTILSCREINIGWPIGLAIMIGVILAECLLVYLSESSEEMLALGWLLVFVGVALCILFGTTTVTRVEAIIDGDALWKDVTQYYKLIEIRDQITVLELI